MKKLLLFVTVTILLIACGKSEGTFDKGLRDANKEMQKTLLTSAIMCDKISDVWRTAIYDNRTPNGNYCSDFNDALKELFADNNFSALTDTLSKWNDNMQKLTSKLNEHPQSRKDCYDEFVDIVGEVSSFSRMATSPTGSLRSYNEQTNATSSSISKKLDQFKIKYGKILDED